MSVLIKDMEMPENCAKCKLGEYEDMEWFSCPFLENSYRHNAEFGRLDECPIVADIPETHRRLIDADELIDYCKDMIRIISESDDDMINIITSRICYTSVIRQIINMATVIEADRS